MNKLQQLSRQVSIERVMRAVANYGPLSRASLAKHLGLSKQTISEVMQLLEARGWVQSSGQTKGHVGRRAITYELNPNCAGVVVVDLGGTKIRACVANLVGEIIAEKSMLASPKGGESVLRQIADMIERLLEDASILKNRINLTVIGVPGVFIETSGRVLMAPNIEGFDKMDVRTKLQNRLNLKVVIKNDVNLAAKGEHWLGEESEHLGANNLVFIAVGTGIGVGIIINGELVEGSGGMAGEIGYIPVSRSNTDENDILEDHLSGVALAKRYANAYGQPFTAKKIFELAENGDANALRFIEDLVEILARTIISLNFVINPNKFVLGGSIGSSGLLRNILLQKLARSRWQVPAVEISSTGHYAALAGGVAIGLEQTQHDLFAATFGEGIGAGRFIAFKNVDTKQFVHSIGGGQ